MSRRDRSSTIRHAGPAPRIVLAGRPGAGKGTQGVRLARRMDVQYLSTGDLLRDEITARSALGRAVERFVESGRLVPTRLIVAIVENNLRVGGYVLDGFPRTVAQATALFERESLAPSVAIEIVVPADVVVERVTARGRGDDAPSVARERLVTFDTETAQALRLFDRRGLLIRVDGNAPPDVVESRIRQALATDAQPAPYPAFDAAMGSANRACRDIGVV
jgi:adenylate kinase